MILQGIIEKALEESVLDTFSTTASLPPMMVEGDLNLRAEDAVFAFIEINGNIKGKLGLSMTILDACYVVKSMMGIDDMDDPSMVVDGIGEIVNIVVGGLKNRLYQTGFNLNIGLPRVKKGVGSKEMNIDDAIEVSKTFICDELRFIISLNYELIEGEQEKGEDVKAKIDPFESLSKAISEAEKKKTII